MKPSLQLNIGHQLAITPQLQQAIRLLQLSNFDLSTEIENFLTDNPFLEKLESAHPWESWGKQSLDEPKLEPIQKAGEMNLQEYLVWQMELAHFNEKDKLIAASLIDAINEEGFLELELTDLQLSLNQCLKVELQDIETVLHHIQQFEPLGVGSRNLKECLLVQAESLNRSNKIDSRLANKLLLLIDQFLPLVAKQEFITLKRKLDISPSELKIIIDKLKSLCPKPGLLIGNKTTEYIIPDLIVSKQGNQWMVELNPEATPKIQLNDHYISYIKQYKKPAEIPTLKNQIQEAKSFIKALETRHDTLLRVATCIINRQTAFLESGDEALKPMILQDIAEAVGLHESTVSRVTTQKFIHTPRGTFELKYFFSAVLPSPDGQDFSAKAIKAIIKKTIHQETLTKPYSDGFLAEKLNQAGIPVARRTVAKYREQLGIPPAHARKRIT